jgi:hypothetical protein
VTVMASDAGGPKGVEAAVIDAGTCELLAAAVQGN